MTTKLDPVAEAQNTANLLRQMWGQNPHSDNIETVLKMLQDATAPKLPIKTRKAKE